MFIRFRDWPLVTPDRTTKAIIGERKISLLVDHAQADVLLNIA